MLTFAAAKNGGLAQLARAPALHAGGQRFESVIHQFPENARKQEVYVIPHASWDVCVNVTRKVSKGAWRMPWLSEAMKDVISCDKPRGGANDLRSADLRMGQPGTLKRYHPSMMEANAGN